jgi:phosphoglycolate phosphatase
MPCRYRKTLLLDLDGTLIDPASGIIGSCRYALERLHLEVPEEENLRWIIGPPLRESFERLLRGQADAEAALRFYRERYAERGLWEAYPYPGIMDALERRRADGTRLILCTSKPAFFAQQVVNFFGFASLLSGVYGPELDGRFDDKGDLIGHLMATEKLSPEETCMVGDRRHDVQAASRHKVPTVRSALGLRQPRRARECRRSRPHRSPSRPGALDSPSTTHSRETVLAGWRTIVRIHKAFRHARCFRPAPLRT